MAKNSSELHVVGADLMRGNLLVHFSNGTSTLFHAPFLYEVRNHDGNVEVSEGPEDEQGEQRWNL